MNWTLRFLSAVTEACGNALVTGVPGCQTGADIHNLHSVLYHDLQVSWTDAFRLIGLKVDVGVNNLFGTNPPICFTCTLNGYDAGTYDLPGSFWNLRVTYTF